jgi:phage terminase large subunit
MPQMQIPKKLLPLINKKKRFKVIIGGRGSGKSMTVGDLLLMRVQTKKEKIGCFREYQNSIDDSVHSLLSDEIDRLRLQGFNTLDKKITHIDGGEFKFRGLARSPDAIKSMHGFNVFWVEESQTISAKSLKALTPTLRTHDSEIWFTGNPRSSADPFSQKFIKPFEKQLIKNGYYEDDLHLIIVCNYCDNSLFPDVLDQERQHDEETLSTAEYNHIWLGHFNDEVDNSIITVDWFNAAIDAHKKLGFEGGGALIAAHDPSDTGSDSKGYCLRHGSVILECAEKETGDVNDGCDWATNKAINARADYFGWDCDGLGVSLKRQVEQALRGKKVESYMFKGSEGVENETEIYQAHEYDDRATSKTNKETFRNRRAQYYWRLRDRFYNTYRAVIKGDYVNPDEMISISSKIEDLDALRAEVCRIPLKQNNNGLIQIMSKVDMGKLGIASPNMADSLMMSMYQPKPKIQAKKLNFKGWG